MSSVKDLIDSQNDDGLAGYIRVGSAKEHFVFKLGVILTKEDFEQAMKDLTRELSKTIFPTQNGLGRD